MPANLRHRSGGFTLIELLVVIGVISFLIALIAMIAPNVIAKAREASTKATIKKADEAVQNRMQAISRDIDRQDLQVSVGVPPYRQEDQYAPEKLSKLCGKKRFLKWNCPQVADDVHNDPNFTTYYAGNVVSAADSAELLYYFLTQGKQFSEAGDVDLFTATELGDTDGDSIKELVDGWGRPLRYYRYPTRLFRPADPPSTHQSINTMANPDEYGIKIKPKWSTTSGESAKVLFTSIKVPTGTLNTVVDEKDEPLAADPHDPLRVMQEEFAKTSPRYTADAFEHEFHAPDTYWAPLIVSSGDDGGLGLYEPHDTANHGYWAQPMIDKPTDLATVFDNITNHQQ